MKVSQKLQVARDLLAQGWTAGTLVSKGIDGRAKYCARGALNKAFLGSATSDAEYTPDDELRLAQRLVAAAMNGERFRDEFDDITVRYVIQHSNDNQRGKACVVAAFDAAIAECKRLEDDAEKALAEEFTMLPVTQGESHQRRDPLTTTGPPTVRTTRTDPTVFTMPTVLTDQTGLTVLIMRIPTTTIRATTDTAQAHDPR